jgi:uncharacterized protein (TIGR04255 family)
MMKLGKPPIIQAWIEFRFDHGDERREWGLNEASDYLDRFQADYPEREALFQRQFRIEKVQRHRNPEVVPGPAHVQAVRASKTEGSRYIQLTRDAMACNFLRTEKGYDGFDALKAEALEKFRAYVEMYQPTRLLEFAVHYVDLVVIPFEPDKALDLDEYFTLGISLPDPAFGSILNFVVQYATQPPDTEYALEVRLQDERDPQGLSARFRMDWRLSGSHELILSEADVAAHLEQAHDRLLGCFQKSFTEKAWQMFEPIQEKK